MLDRFGEWSTLLPLPMLEGTVGLEDSLSHGGGCWRRMHQSHRQDHESKGTVTKGGPGCFLFLKGDLLGKLASEGAMEWGVEGRCGSSSGIWIRGV